ncbi:hypothetical protein [Streptomyces exfoliatus]|uniref:hypothetical protein n=1 Tax=Streptomyces exfoliatus TaxID=1905 RepID=UPI0012FF2A0F|nr:hypothetical protein [Streptomyces exfoliatus]
MLETPAVQNQQPVPDEVLCTFAQYRAWTDLSLSQFSHVTAGIRTGDGSPISASCSG